MSSLATFDNNTHYTFERMTTSMDPVIENKLEKPWPEVVLGRMDRTLRSHPLIPVGKFVTYN